MGTVPESDKAQRYLQQLDDARCAGRWQDTPELCRKVEKHAPHRRCLTLTARAEAHIAAHTVRPASQTGLSDLIPPLLSAIDEEPHAQDAFQATVCLGWLHYVLDEPGLALARLPNDFGAVAASMSSNGDTTTTTVLGGWTRVGLVKGAYLKGISQERTGTPEDALCSYTSILSWLTERSSIATETLQFRMWSEHLLVRLCQLCDQSTDTGEYVDPEEALQAYRMWARYWESTANSGASLPASGHHRSAWKAYYDTLSAILRHDYPYTPESGRSENDTEKTSPTAQSTMRLQQRAELKRVEAIYESLLLKETHFPKASENNDELEAWADAVMGNWRILCGPTWSDEQLGEGGKEAVGRGVLDILYRAAMKTFHSTQLLRHLFTVHASLAEFELAFKAYDSYVEIVTRGKDRAEKTGEPETGIDDDGTILRTSAEAIRILCRFGSRTEAEKAVDIGDNIEKWLEQTEHTKSVASDAGSIGSADTTVEPRSLAIAYCAIGVSQAHWARLTYDADARAGLQAKAIQYLRKSLSPSLGDPNNIDALYALALVLAETRDVPAAIKTAKRALSPATKSKTTLSLDGVISNGLTTEYARERKLIPMWHLLALLLTSRSDYAAAEKACEAAFEQFGDSSILFGKEDASTYRSEHLNQASGKDSNSVGIVDQMENFERGDILQTKMTQLSLVEVVDGVNTAVDGCDELLALYARLFGDPATQKAKLQPPAATLQPPKSSAGTIRGSIFRGKGSARSPKDDIARSSVVSSRPSTIAIQTNQAPSIQVTDEDANRQSNSHRHSRFHHKQDEEEEHAGVQRSPSKLQKRSANSLRRKSELEAEQAQEVPDIPEVAANGSGHPTRPSSARTKSPHRLSMSDLGRRSIESSDRPLRPIAHNMPHASEPAPPGHNQQPPKQDTRLPVTVPGADYIPPGPHFTQLQERRQKVSLLIDIWVYISGLYVRAEMFEDAKEAVNEALKLAETFEGEVAQESSTSKAFADRGWGGGKSVEELWADAFTARGEMLVAQALKHEARADFERAVLHFPDHPEAIVGLSNILLDIYCEEIPLELSNHPETVAPWSQSSVSVDSDSDFEPKKQHLASHTPSAENQMSPPELSRLAARDRAYGLLSTLTKLGSGWDYSEAWYTLARAYEESAQVEKTKEVLWWCVELEDTHPVRSWKSASLGGHVI